jgi:hypothetical protein
MRFTRANECSSSQEPVENLSEPTPREARR